MNEDNSLLKPGSKTSEYRLFFWLVIGFLLLGAVVTVFEVLKTSGASFAGSQFFGIMATVAGTIYGLIRLFLKARFGDKIGRLENVENLIKQVIGDSLQIIDEPITGNRQPTADGQIPERRDD